MNPLGSGVKKAVEKTIFASFNKLIRKLEIPDVFEVQFGLYVSSADKIMASNHCQRQCKVSIIGVEVENKTLDGIRLVSQHQIRSSRWRHSSANMTRTLLNGYMIKQFEGDINVRKN